MNGKTIDYKIALLIDGPNMVNTDLKSLNSIAQKQGDIIFKEVFLKKMTNPNLISFFINHGYTTKFSHDKYKDVDPYIIARASEMILSPNYSNVNTIGLVGGDKDYLPIINLAKVYGKSTIVFGESSSISNLLRYAADNYVMLKPRKIIRPI